MFTDQQNDLYVNTWCIFIACWLGFRVATNTKTLSVVIKSLVRVYPY